MIFSFYSNKVRTIYLSIAMIVATIIFAFSAPGFSQNHDIGILLADDHGKTLYQKNEKQLFIPASITKILTSLCALETLGAGYRFETWVGYDPAGPDLYIKGFGDPLFISEQIQDLADKIIQKTRAGSIRNIVLDHGFFQPDIIIPGTGQSKNPYDATTGALCANFNTIFFRWDKIQNQFTSAEPQTPLLDIFREELHKSGKTSGRVLLSRRQRRLYPGLLIKAFLEDRKVSVHGTIKEEHFPAMRPGSTRIIFKSSFTLDRIIEKLLQFSNNFIANQLMLTMGAKEYGSPATLEIGMNHLKGFAGSRLGLTDFILIEGSGLSRKNRFSPEQMLKILMAFTPHYRLMKKEGCEFYKTGTLTDVRTRAGYFTGSDNRLYPFVIMVNQQGTGYAGILQKLKGIVSKNSTSR